MYGEKALLKDVLSRTLAAVSLIVWRLKLVLSCLASGGGAQSEKEELEHATCWELGMRQEGARKPFSPSQRTPSPASGTGDVGRPCRWFAGSKVPDSHSARNDGHMKELAPWKTTNSEDQTVGCTTHSLHKIY